MSVHGESWVTKPTFFPERGMILQNFRVRINRDVEIRKLTCLQSERLMEAKYFSCSWVDLVIKDYYITSSIYEMLEWKCVSKREASFTKSYLHRTLNICRYLPQSEFCTKKTGESKFIYAPFPAKLTRLLLLLDQNSSSPLCRLVR